MRARVAYAPWILGCLLGACTRGEPPNAVPVAAPQVGSSTPSASQHVVSSAAPATSAATLPGASSGGELGAAPLVHYPFGRVHSPLGALAVARLRDLTLRDAALASDVLLKVGDSITFSDDSLKCFSRRARTLPRRAPLGEHEALAPVIERFLAGRAAGADSLARDSLSAKIGWSAWQALDGAAPPLEREQALLHARWAIVQYGTNDIEMHALHHFADKLFDVVDWLVTRGVVPIVVGIPPRRDRADARDDAVRYAAVARGVALARGALFVDYALALGTLPGSGLGGDGIHPSAYQGAHGHDGCDLRPEALENGYNLRNLLVMEALQRAIAAVEQGVALDEDVRVPGSGRHGAPWRVAAPFVLATPTGGDSAADHGPSCAGAGAYISEQVVHFDLAAAQDVQVLGFDRGAKTDLFLLRERDGATSCLAWGERAVTRSLPAGAYSVALATRAASLATATHVLAVLTAPNARR